MASTLPLFPCTIVGSYPQPAWLIDRGMRTLSVRMERHNSNGMAVAQWAEQHTGIARVHYPGLPSHPNYAHAKAALAGFGGMLGLELKGGAKAAPAANNDSAN